MAKRDTNFCEPRVYENDVYSHHLPFSLVKCFDVHLKRFKVIKAFPLECIYANVGVNKNVIFIITTNLCTLEKKCLTTAVK